MHVVKEDKCYRVAFNAKSGMDLDRRASISLVFQMDPAISRFTFALPYQRQTYSISVGFAE